jgi:uncharacterized SAM-binding protein YcdF (DUF218 family)
MFFVLSKVLTFFCLPSNLLVALGLAGLILGVIGRRRAAAAALALAIVGLALAGWSPLPNLLLETLEDRFPPYADDGVPVAGIIVLGGSFDTLVSGSRGVVALNDSAERLTEAVALARRDPAAKLVFTGGDWTLFAEGPSEASLARRFFSEFGVPPERVVFEDQARTTSENALNLKALLVPKPGERWLLLTSGFHMPRSIGSFRAAGFDVVAYPVDFRTRGRTDWLQLTPTLSDGLRKLDIAAREYWGLVAYRLAGRSSELLPAP